MCDEGIILTRAEIGGVNEPIEDKKPKIESVLNKSLRK